MNATTSNLYFNNHINNINITQNKKQEYFGIRNCFKKIKKNISDKFKNTFESKKYYVNEPEVISKNKNSINNNINNNNINNNNNNKEKKNITKQIIIHITHVIIYFISYCFYFLSLKRCFEGEDICTSKLGWIIIAIIELIISLIINAVLFILMIYNKVSPLNLIHFIIVFILFYQYSNDTISEDHGYYNFVAFFSLLWLIILLELLIHGIIILIKSKYKYFIFVFISLFIILFIIIYQKNPMNCEEWALGLNNTYLENDINKYGCQIQIPKHCTYKIYQSTQDISKITKLDCSLGKSDARKTLLDTLTSPYINRNTKRFGYPLTNKGEVAGLDGKDKWVLLNYTYENMIDMDNITKDIQDFPEQIVDFTKNENGELIINLNFNETLSQERKKLENNLNSYSNNIMILYIDSVSRAHAMRQLKKTMQFFDKFSSYQGGHHEKYPDENFHSFQFFKYHCFKWFTPGNFPVLFYGNKKEVNNLTLITKYLKENGYVTNYCSDECKKDNTRTHHNMTESEIYDHQMLLCDPNIVQMNKPVKKCLYGNLNSYHLYEYGKQFWIKYKNNRKFSAMVTNDGHESSLEALKYSDDIFYNYLTTLYNQNLLKDTTILMVSDHGTTLPSIYYLDDFFQIEGRLPMLFILVNDRKNVSYNDQYYYIQKNQQTFITAYDFYNTVANILYGDNYTEINNKTDDFDTPKSPLGQSLFNYIDQSERSPMNYQSMDKNICK